MKMKEVKKTYEIKKIIYITFFNVFIFVSVTSCYLFSICFKMDTHYQLLL